MKNESDVRQDNESKPENQPETRLDSTEYESPKVMYGTCYGGGGGTTCCGGQG